MCIRDSHKSNDIEYALRDGKWIDTSTGLEATVPVERWLPERRMELETKLNDLGYTHMREKVGIAGPDGNPLKSSNEYAGFHDLDQKLRDEYYGGNEGSSI